MSPRICASEQRRKPWDGRIKVHNTFARVGTRLLVTVASIMVLVFSAPTFSQPQALPRRQLLSTAVAPGLGAGLATIVSQPEAVTAISPATGVEIRRSAQGLNELVERWDKDVQVEDRLTEGANIAREMLLIRYVKDLLISVPEGETAGIDLDFKCFVSKVSKPQYGFAVGDYIASVNGLEVQRNQEFLDRYVKRAQAAGKPLKFGIQRTYPPLLDNLEKKLQDVYLSVDDDGALPDLEEIQLLIGETKVLATSAASGTSVSYVIMNRFKEAVTKLRNKMVPVAKAIV